MAKFIPLPSIETLRQLLEADFDAGLLFYKRRPEAGNSWNTRYEGKPALNVLSDNGYLKGTLERRQLLAHRVLFALYHGRTDFAFIDHINGNRTDNRITNLREVDYLANARNKARAKNNTSGVTGVRVFANGTYGASVTVGSVKIILGTYGSLPEASAARRAAEVVIGFHENHGRNTA